MPITLGGSGKQCELGFENHAECSFAPDEPIDGIVREGIADSILLEIGTPELHDVAVREGDEQRVTCATRRAVLERASP